MATSPLRALVGSLALAAALAATTHLNAQARSGTVLQNGQVVVNIYVTMTQAGLTYGRPISDFTFMVVAPSGERSAVTTSDAGTTELHLAPGQYRVVSIKPLDWFDHHYMWDLPFEVREGMHVLDLTPRNSAQEVAYSARSFEQQRVTTEAPTRSPAMSAPQTLSPSVAPSPDLYKSPGVAALFSFIIPGVGQMYNGHVGRGVGLLVISTGALVAGAAASNNYSCSSYDCNRDYTPLAIGAVVSVGVWIYSIFDAYGEAKQHNAQAGFRVGNIPARPYVGGGVNGTTTVGLSLALR